MINPLEIVATLREGLLVLNEDLTVDYASDRFLVMFGVDRDETTGRNLADLGDGQWDISSLIVPLQRMIETDETIDDYEVEHAFEHIGRKVMRVNARKTVREGNGSKLILLVIDDVTVATDHARELGRQRRLAEGIVATLREPLLVMDGDLKILEASRAFYLKFKVDASHTLGHNLSDLGNGQWANADLIRLLAEVIPNNMAIEDYELTHDFPQIGTRTMLLNARKLFREGNNTKALLLAMEDVTDRNRLEAERNVALERSSQLLEELNHRVMNSLTMIGAVITMEGRTLSDDECRSAFERMRNRINSIAALYRRLTHTSAVDTVDADEYLDAVIRETVSSVEDTTGEVDLDISIDKIALSTRIAVPLGLIVNELATNSLKYAFQGRDTGRLGLTLTYTDDGIALSVWDDGPGIDHDTRVDSGLGQKLVTSFVQQLGGDLSHDSGSMGTRYTLRIPDAELARLQTG